MNDLYTFTIPLFIKSLGGLKVVLEKAKAHCAETGLSEEALLQDRLAPDMFPLVKQVQVATDNAKGAAARLAGMEIPAYEDSETTIDALIARIDRTTDFLTSVPESAFEGAATRKVELRYFPGKHFKGFDYAREYAIPNFYFHLVTAYGLVRKNGVRIGKADYVNGLTLNENAVE